MEDATFDLYESFGPGFWWVWSRRDLVDRAVKTVDCDRRTAKILDIGAGSGLLYPVLKRHGAVTNLEKFEEGLKHLRRKGIPNVVEGDAENLPMADGSIDVVVAFDVMEHVSDDCKMMREVHRVLKKGGSFILTVPAFMFLWSDDDDLVHHKRRYSLARLKRRVKSRFRIKLASYRFFFIFLPTFVLFIVKRLIKKVRGSNYVRNSSLERRPSRWVNCFLKTILRFENLLVTSGFRFPFGVSIFMVLEKK